MLHRINRDCFRACGRRDRGNDSVLVGRIFMNDRHAAVAARGDIDELLAGPIRAHRPPARSQSSPRSSPSSRSGRRTSARAGEYPVGGPVIGNPLRSVASIRGHEAIAVIVFVSITWIVFFLSLLTKSFPFPSEAAPSGESSSSFPSPVIACRCRDGSRSPCRACCGCVSMTRSEKSS